MLDLENWSLFSLLDSEVLSSIKSASVFGSSGNEAIYITNSDEVFSFGSNCSGCLGIGDSVSTLEPRRIDSLCRKRLCGFAFGSGPHVLAFTENGEVYSWGHNGYCQLGNGNSNQSNSPILISTNLSGKRVIQVACGSHHSMALTADGEIFSWGQNNCGQIGSGSTTNQPTPRKITSCIGHRKVIRIACGQTSSMAVLDSGDIFGWGYNGNGQLGIGNNVNQPNPGRLSSLQGIFITQITCGYAHSMALSDEGELYVWGANSYGQLGTGNKANVIQPTRIGNERTRFVEIAATHYNHISAASTQTGQVFMWGQCRGQSIVSPLLTNFHSLHKVFANFGFPAVTWTPLEIEHNSFFGVQESMANAFNDSDTSDIKFKIEGNFIYAHKSVLKIRCEYFRRMFQTQWNESGKEVIEIPNYSYAVYHAFLRYLYTDKVDLSPEDAIGLLDLSNAYCEDLLKKMCERIIKQGITLDNCAMLYAAAIKYDAKELQDFCFRFSMNHMTAVTQTISFSQLEEDTLKSFILRAAKNGAFKS